MENEEEDDKSTQPLNCCLFVRIFANKSNSSTLKFPAQNQEYLMDNGNMWFKTDLQANSNFDAVETCFCDLVEMHMLLEADRAIEFRKTNRNAYIYSRLHQDGVDPGGSGTGRFWKGLLHQQ